MKVLEHSELFFLMLSSNISEFDCTRTYYILASNINTPSAPFPFVTRDTLTKSYFRCRYYPTIWESAWRELSSPSLALKLEIPGSSKASSFLPPAYTTYCTYRMRKWNRTREKWRERQRGGWGEARFEHPQHKKSGLQKKKKKKSMRKGAD